ncbi:MAG: hypothetical protein QOF14_1614 [Hyphomicrobiales bacterium]|nr:hypothetical protein [Hyphomicrobiales bacterium]
MPDEATSLDPALEQKRLDLEENKLDLEKRRFESDKSFQERDIRLKEKESGWRAKLFSPLTATLIAGVLTLAGSVVGTLLQSSKTFQLEQTRFAATRDLEQAKFQATRDLEREKFNFTKETDAQKQQHELVLKMISAGDEKQSKRNLEFLAKSGLIPDELSKKILSAAKDSPPNLPPISGRSPLSAGSVCGVVPSPGDSNIVCYADANGFCTTCATVPVGKAR